MCDIIDALVALAGWLIGRLIPPEAIAAITRKLEQNRRDEEDPD